MFKISNPKLIATVCIMTTWVAAPALGKELWHGDGIQILLNDGFTCAATAEVDVNAGSVALFEEPSSSIQKALSSALAAYSFTCKKLERVSISGLVSEVNVFNGAAEKAKAWKLVAQPSELEQEAGTIASQIHTIEDLPRITDTLARYHTVPDFYASFQYFVYMNAAKRRAQEIIQDTGDVSIERRVDLLYAKHRNAAAVHKELEPSIKAIAAILPEAHKALERRYRAKIDVLITAEWNGFLPTLLEEADIYGDTIERLAAKVGELPPHEALGAQIDIQVNDWLVADITAYSALLENGHAIDLSEKRQLAGLLGTLQLPPFFQKSRETLVTETQKLQEEVTAGIAALSQAARSLIAATGSDYSDFDAVFEAGTALADEFKEAGFEAETQDILNLAVARSNDLIVQGLSALKKELSSTPMTLANIAVYREQEAIFDELALSHAGFEPYSSTIEEGIAEGREKQCQEQTKQAVADEKNLAEEILTGQGPVTVETLACHLYRNDHILLGFDPGGLFSAATIEIDRSGQGAETYTLKMSGDDRSYYGATINGETLDEASWIAVIDELRLLPPSGKPDANGATECDKLAGDADDPLKVATGIDLDSLPPDYNFARAIDACIAAIEFNPESVRFHAYLARLLYFLGEEKEANVYAEKAAKLNYPTALYLSAQMSLMKDSEDTFYDAIEPLKMAANTGHLAAKKLLNQINPSGLEFFRPLPPPSDAQILALIGGKRCNFIQHCFHYTDLYSKNCFQIAKGEFSCELQMTMWCAGDVVNNAILGRSCNGAMVSDPMFYNFKIERHGSWHAFER